jgi:hypothetical protein
VSKNMRAIARLRAGVLISACAWLGLAGAARGQDERQALCGFVFPVASYQADIDGVRIALTANDRLEVNGRIVAEHGIYDEGRPPQPWGDSANQARIAVTNEYLLIQTMWTDCVDYASARIFVLSRRGELVATSALWSLHDAWSGFAETSEGLTFSSEWLCGEYSGAPAGRAYVYVLRHGSREFAREERAWNSTCAVEPNRSLPRGRIHFSLMQPVSP